MGLDAELIEELRLGAELHDIGKIGTREPMLNKPAQLTEEEFLHIMGTRSSGRRCSTPLLKNTPEVLRDRAVAPRAARRPRAFRTG